MQTITEKLEIEKMIHTFDANPLRSLCALCGFAREEQLSRDNFSRQAAKVAKEKHEYFCNDFPRLMLAIARLAQKYAIRVHYDPLAGRGPCDRTPLQDNQFPIRGANGHKGRALQMAGTTHKRTRGSLRGLILRSNNSVARLSSRLREKIYTAAARIDLHHSKGFMGLGQNRHPTRLNLGDALAKSGRSARLRHRAGCPNAEAGGVVCAHADNASGFCFC